MAWKSALPGSPVVMCHQSNSTGPAASDAASDGAVDSAADGAAADGAADGALVAPPPPEQAATSSVVVARTPNMRQRVDTTRPPPVRAAGQSVLRAAGAPPNVRCRCGCWERRCGDPQCRSPDRVLVRFGARKFRSGGVSVSGEP